MLPSSDESVVKRELVMALLASNRPRLEALATRIVDLLDLSRLQRAYKVFAVCSRHMAFPLQEAKVLDAIPDTTSRPFLVAPSFLWQRTFAFLDVSSEIVFKKVPAIGKNRI